MIPPRWGTQHARRTMSPQGGMHVAGLTPRESTATLDGEWRTCVIVEQVRGEVVQGG